MNRLELDQKVSELLKLVRVEYDFTQDKMAEILGISKKTLVQIEKGRQLLGWNNVVCFVTIFKDSQILQMNFGEDLFEIIQTLSFGNFELHKVSTLGGKVWWKEISRNEYYRIQQNIISQHYRILDHQDYRISSSFELDYITQRMLELTKQINEKK